MHHNRKLIGAYDLQRATLHGRFARVTCLHGKMFYADFCSKVFCISLSVVLYSYELLQCAFFVFLIFRPVS